MNYVKQNPVGLDALVLRVQNKLHSNLETVWGVTIDGYGRCYIVDENGLKHVKNFVGKNEYQTISVAEANKFFFLHGNQKSKKIDNSFYETEIQLVFIVDLKSLKPDVEHRADFEVHNDVESVLNQVADVLIDSVEYGYENVLRGVYYLQENDLQPYHVFKFNLKVNYESNDVCYN